MHLKTIFWVRCSGGTWKTRAGKLGTKSDFILGSRSLYVRVGAGQLELG